MVRVIDLRKDKSEAHGKLYQENSCLHGRRKILPQLERRVRLDPKNSILMKYVHLASPIGCYSDLNFPAQVTTNQRRYTELCRATSSEWNFSGPVSNVKQLRVSSYALAK